MCNECILAPQNVPSAIVLTLGNKVVLYCIVVFRTDRLWDTVSVVGRSKPATEIHAKWQPT